MKERSQQSSHTKKRNQRYQEKEQTLQMLTQMLHNDRLRDNIDDFSFTVDNLQKKIVKLHEESKREKMAYRNTMIASAKDFRNVEESCSLINSEESMATSKVRDSHFHIRDQRNIIDEILQAIVSSVDLCLLSMNNVRYKVYREK